MNGWLIDRLTDEMADGSADGSGLRWIDEEMMEKIKFLAAGLPESLLSSRFLVFCTVFIGDSLVSNDQTHFLR